MDEEGREERFSGPGGTTQDNIYFEQSAEHSLHITKFGHETEELEKNERDLESTVS